MTNENKKINAMVEIGAENEKYIDDKKISQAFDMLFPKDKLPLK